MTRQLYILFSVLLLGSCYTGKEHRLWENREKKNLPDSYFFSVLKDTADKSAVKIIYNYPYIHVAQDAFFHPFTFDKYGKVYSDAWRKEKPTLTQITDRQHFIGYYKIYGDTIVIEKIASWTLGRKIPWKFVHQKTIGIVTGDTIKIPRQSIDIKEKNTLYYPLDNYWPLDEKAGR